MIRFFRENKINIFFIAFFVCAFLFATGVAPHLAIKVSALSGITVKADFLVASVISLGLLRGKKYASLFALPAGFLFDIFVGNPYMFSPLVFFLCAWFSSLAATPFSKRTPITATIISAELLLIKAIVSFFYLIAVSGDSGTGKILLLGVLPEYIVNVVVCAIVFSVMRILMALFRISPRPDIGA